MRVVVYNDHTFRPWRIKVVREDGSIVLRLSDKFFWHRSAKRAASRMYPNFEKIDGHGRRFR